MAAGDPIHVSRENRQEQRSLVAIDRFLEPWRITWSDQRDDFGRDGFVQVIDVEGERATLSPLTCTIQAKSHAAAFSDTVAERFEHARSLSFVERDLR